MSDLGLSEPSKPMLPASFPQDFTGTWKCWRWENGKPVMLVGHGWPRRPGTVALHD